MSTSCYGTMSFNICTAQMAKRWKCRRVFWLTVKHSQPTTDKTRCMETNRRFTYLRLCCLYKTRMETQWQLRWSQRTLLLHLAYPNTLLIGFEY